MPGFYSKFKNAGYHTNLMGRFDAGNPDVFIQVFDSFGSPAQSGVEIPITSSGCFEFIGTDGQGTGRYGWSTVNLPTQPTSRLELLYVMHASGVAFDGKAIVGSPEADGITSSLPEDGMMPQLSEGSGIFIMAAISGVVL